MQWRFLAAVAMASCELAFGGKASFHGSSLSLRVGPVSGMMPGVGAATNHLTTPDGLSGFPANVLTNNGQLVFSGEVRPENESFTSLLSDYVTFNSSGGIDQYGQLALTATAFPDTNQNGISDLYDPGIAVSLNLEGMLRVDWPVMLEATEIRYQLIDGSFLVDECLPCSRPPIQYAMRGSFTLRVIEQNPIVSRYAIEDLVVTAGSAEAEYKIAANGTFEFGGEVALRQQMILNGDIKSPSQTNTVVFTNVSVAVSRLWPMIAITLQQTNGTLASTISLTIAAAPLREIWFSTAAGFHSANLPTPQNEIGSGDILSSQGRVVKTNRQLQENFINDPTNIGLDAFDLLPGGEIGFSTETATPFGDGGIAFARSAQLLRFDDILPALAPSITEDPGLDALHFVTDSRFYFSIKKDVIIFQDPQPNIILRNGDILWVDVITREGGIFKFHNQLLSRFNLPASYVAIDLGLDALYIWPSGEIWFSTRDGFDDLKIGPIGGGDLLSDQGYIVYRNLELVSAFAPIEDASSFGLDALCVITDVYVATGQTLLSINPNESSGSTLRWKGGGRVFQVEATADLNTPFDSVSAITPDLVFTNNASAPSPAQFYRVRQW